MRKKLLIKLHIIQEYDNKDGKLGLGYRKVYRLNPYNPLSYIIVIVSLLLAFLLFGAVGMWKEFDLSNPFKWN